MNCPNSTATPWRYCAIQQLSLSARAYDRLLKVARTIADLGGLDDIQVAHVTAAIQCRSLDRKFWGM